ncbi:MAG TPA: hypothetical protein VK302_07700 [Terriglobales bacterium]|nr:hypothetical protein [Terriglobales bacterium]
MKLFRVIKMEGSYWGVFLVNQNDATDRKLVSSTFDNERDAADCAADCNRIVSASATVVKNSVSDVYKTPKRKIKL